ncbi:TPA: hypothetical protein DDZ10_04935 [Candidatus Uhrbacteria bacterium]|nr:MAG: hypothetical protein A3D69_00595 [Candidatus Uhrbacteria bacterium RIFCSPHIGHO2_02_FULL_54_11]HBL39978.1 hypothetical protein [Candidatus Uhrbacteria bacterium]
MIRYVIVGAGIAGTSAAEEIRKCDQEGEITLIGEEEHALYSRVLLPHYIKGKIPREKCFLKREAWYDEQRIEYLRGERVESIDTAHRHVVLKIAGRELPYDKLLITTGGEPSSINADVRGISYLQTLDDADHLLQLLGELAGKHDARAAVCGGGFIACEYLNIFKHFGIPTTCFHRGPWFWSRVLGEESGRLIESVLKREDVEVWPQTTLADISAKGGSGSAGHGSIQVETTNGLARADLLGIGIGLGRDLRWIQKSGIEVEAGVRTNSFLETSVEGVWAAGDVAEFDDPLTGHAMMGGNWMNAIMQGRTAGKSMVGERTEFRLVTSYATNIFGTEIIFIGDTRRALADEVRVEGTAGEGAVTQRFYDSGRLVGATMVGTNKDRMKLAKEIENT